MAMKKPTTQKTRSTRQKLGRESSPGRQNTPVIQPNGRPLFQIKMILVPIDFAPESEKALVYAVPFARQFGAKLTLVHIIEPIATPDFADAFPLALQEEEVITSGTRHLQRIVKDLQIEPGLVGNLVVRFGRAFHEIVEAANSNHADLIIMSTHGYTGLEHTFLGSTAERVVRHATCPVLVVRPREREFVTRTQKTSTRSVYESKIQQTR